MCISGVDMATSLQWKFPMHPKCFRREKATEVGDAGAVPDLTSPTYKRPLTLVLLNLSLILLQL
jgi:hypothetical protein